MKFVPTPSPSVSITMGLVTLTVLLFLFMDLGLGVIPDEEQNTIDLRENISTNLALQLGPILHSDERDNLARLLNSVQERNDDILSIAVRHASGRLIAQSGLHKKFWIPPPQNQSTLTNVQVPMLAGDNLWANMEISFRPVGNDSFIETLRKPGVTLPLGIFLGGTVFYYLYLRRVLQHLDPTRVIPERISSALDTFTEGVMIMDTRTRVMLINDAFKSMHPEAGKISIGQKASALTWLNAGCKDSDSVAPWSQVLQKKESVTQQLLKLSPGSSGERLLMVNASPILDGYGKLRGCMVTLRDITEQERTNKKLRETMNQLQASKGKIEAQNSKLQQLANFDQLTGLMNRYAFFEKGNQHFADYRKSKEPLACVMCDIDHFKSVNDNYGHSTGDEVIRVVTGFLRDTVRSEDLVGRYGGEEFCIILPGVPLETARQITERIRSRIEKLGGKNVPGVKNLKITSSFGITMLNSATESLADLIEQADQALYLSKKNGRNQVTIYSI